VLPKLPLEVGLVDLKHTVVKHRSLPPLAPVKLVEIPLELLIGYLFALDGLFQLQHYAHCSLEPP